MSRTADYKPKLALFSLLVVFSTTFLLYAGGFTTSIGAGMVFPDWPLSNGSLNPEGWLEDKAMLAEHSHRLLGTTIGILTISLTVWIWIRDSRRWMRMLAVGSLVAVVLQGLLGGFRVLLNNIQFAMIHGCVAHLFLCLLVSIAAGQSTWWFRNLSRRDPGYEISNQIKRLGLFVCGLIFVQLIVGAIMRHSGAGLAIPTFPLTPEGGLIPESWNFRVGIHFAHRCMAVIIFLSYIFWASQMVTSKALDVRIKNLGWIGIFLLFTQVTLGAMVIWTYRSSVPTTVHVLVGAFLFAISWVITFFQFKPSLKEPVAPMTVSPESIDFAKVTPGPSQS
ncbi:MAG: COX15/CtaA family protein [Verrucomicrobia bacterium]|nr:COX15/CtaA family protein [Verrucomicrobiota bacterium]MDA1068026.1 COX15/CtaA family protein [Verrucomicrobiota bacterium]